MVYTCLYPILYTPFMIIPKHSILITICLSFHPCIHLSPQPLSGTGGPTRSRATVSSSRWNEAQTGVTCQSSGSLDALLPKPNLTTPGLVVLDAFTLGGSGGCSGLWSAHMASVTLPCRYAVMQHYTCNLQTSYRREKDTGCHFETLCLPATKAQPAVRAQMALQPSNEGALVSDVSDRGCISEVPRQLRAFRLAG